MITLEVKDFFLTFENHLNVNPAVAPKHYQECLQAAFPGPLSPRIITEIRSTLARDGYAVIATDLDDFAPATPTSLEDNYDGPYFGEAILSFIATIIGDVQILPYQHNGRPFHDIMPLSAFKDRQTSGSSAVLLEMHTELSFVESPPEYLMLYCVRPDLAGVAETHLYDSQFALPALSAYHCADLASPSYQFLLDENVTDGYSENLPYLPIIDRQTSRLLRFDIDTCRPMDGDAKEAARALEIALLAKRISIRLRFGDLLIVDNKRMVHSRSPFAAKHDGSDRWLKRALIRSHQH
ncbi:TauD/TfdA family dioxygenase [Ahrensia sp. 13_GOM-1096m]|uniref:TauD/TfdA family dioxygenase n=1 Tax=Ahrensia sp. 13_GOM-1096m TaxID=1380380 RepID=UPI0004794319|nr:TauD/TfdA family dioxygenase [Ahrensia sp. 13_GOM-1096m]